MYTDQNSRLWPVRSFNYQSHKITDLPDDLDGMIVILSLTAEGFSNPIATSHGEMLPNTVIATELSSVLNQMFVVRETEADVYELAFTLLFGIVMVFLALKARLSIGGVLAMVPIVGIGYASMYMRAEYMLLYDAVFPIAALLLVFGSAAFSRALEEFRLKQQIKKQFGTYLSPAMVEKLQKNPDLLKLGGEERELSIMFTDVRGFTAISEHYGKDVQGLTKIMNRYMTAMTASILRNEGTLDKYIGDAQMAFWNAPLDDKNHAKNAVKTMLEMLDNLKEFNDEISKEGVPAFGMGLGINTGTVVVGNMGSDQRFDYTCLGDSVNLASRLEGQSKPYGVSNVIGPITYQHIRDQYLCLALDTIAVKGKKEGVDIYTVIGKHDAAYLKVDQDSHTNMMLAYRKRRFDDAIFYAKRLKGCFGGKMDGYYEMWIERCQELKAAKLPDGWDGVYRATSK
jgi:adenylate cyclase